MNAITDPSHGSGARWSLGPSESSNWIDPAVKMQGIETLRTHDPSEKLLNIGGLASRPAGIYAAWTEPPNCSASSPPPLSPASRALAPTSLLRASSPLRPVGGSPIYRAFPACVSAETWPLQSHLSLRLDMADPSAGHQQRAMDLGLHSLCVQGSGRTDGARDATQVTAGPGRRAAREEDREASQ